MTSCKRLGNNFFTRKEFVAGCRRMKGGKRCLCVIRAGSARQSAFDTQTNNSAKAPAPKGSHPPREVMLNEHGKMELRVRVVPRSRN